MATLIRTRKYIHIISVLIDIKIILSKQEKKYLGLVFTKISRISVTYVLDFMVVFFAVLRVVTLYSITSQIPHGIATENIKL
jgi:hypothetical protein